MRETRPNATVTTLLDIVLAASPDRAKAQDEKEEIAQRYKPGDSVFPRDDSTDESGDDTRVLEEVRQLSLQESRLRPRETRHRTPHSRARHSDHPNHDMRRDGGRSRRRRDDDRTGRRHGHERGTRRPEEVAEQTRRIEHQSSLRSLLSLSDAETMEEEILRQILEEGLLDDIDMDNLGPRQEEELSERIAEAYRRRHRLRSHSRQRQEQEQESRESSLSNSSRTPRARSHSAQRSTTRPTRESSRPPASRPYLLEPLVSRPGPSTHQRRSSEGSSRRESPGTAHPAASSETTLRSSARSSSDMTTERPRAPQATTRTPESPTTRRRRATESDRTASHSWMPGSRERGPHHVSGRQSTDSPTSNASPLSSQSAIPHVSASVVSNINGMSNQGGRSRPSSRPSSSRSDAAHAQTPSFIEPSISCNRCGKANIQYELYKECPQCNDGDYHLCLRCHRVGRGCMQWPGFGASAQASFERILCMSNNEPVPAQTPHILQSFRYKRPSRIARRTTNEDRPMANDDPARRLQTGLFCDICKSQANECFWKCNLCNEGDWGFCNRCVNQGRCCTHPLLPICRLSSSTAADPPSQPPTTNPNTNERETFKILSFSTNCDICTHPIPASTTRFHCLTCNDGDYDVCANCYLKLGAAGKISKLNGHNGWRRCLKGHRMVVIGFEDHEEGQRRVVVRDLVGGRALKDEHVYRPSPQAAISSSDSGSLPSPEVGTGDWSWREGSERRKKASRFRPWPHPSTSNHHNHTRTTSTTDSSGSPTTPTQSNPGTPTAATPRFPPDGGVGVVACALWSWYPEDGVEDELMFPRGAEITEGENINDDWFWGCYAGVTGLFPGAHVRVLGEVS